METTIATLRATYATLPPVDKLLMHCLAAEFTAAKAAGNHAAAANAAKLAAALLHPAK